MKLPRLCISAISGGGGKTLLALGLIRLLKGKNFIVKPFKKGPDYIDAAWLALAAGQQTTNLDLWFLPQVRLTSLFVRAMRQIQGDIGIIEGNRGLFDGLDSTGSCSTAELARGLACPVLLTLNCTKMTRTAAAIVNGICNFEPDVAVCGLVLNEVGSSRHEATLRRTLETYTGVPVLGVLPRLPSNPLPERHMGLASFGPGLSERAEATLDSLADFVNAHVDIEAVLTVAETAPNLQMKELSRDDPQTSGFSSTATNAAKSAAPRIGYVHDPALWFYYQENLEALRWAGAELVRLSLFDGRPWPQLDGLYLGGGFPEDMAEQLANSPHLKWLQKMAHQGMPIYAECGGFMLLTQGIKKDEQTWPMAGVFPVIALFCSKPQGLGYVSAEVTLKNPWFEVGLELRGHEFHYSRCVWSAPPPPAVLRMKRGTGMGTIANEPCDGLVMKNVFAAYTHIFAPALPCWANTFTNLALNWRKDLACPGSA